MPAIAAGAALPVVRTRCISSIAADGLTAKRWAASRIELPRSIARTIPQPQVQRHRCRHDNISAVSTHC